MTERQKENFNRIITKYSNSLMRLAFTYTHQMQDAEDIVQDVLIKLFTSEKEFESREHEKAWLIRVTINTSINYVKATKRRQTEELPESLAVTLPQEEQQLLEVIAKMPVKYHAVLYLHYADKEFFTALVGKDKTLILQNDDVQWVFNGKSIKKSDCKWLNLDTKISAKSGAAYGYPDEKKVVKINFENNGKLPGKATIRVNNKYIIQKYTGTTDALMLSYYKDGSAKVEDTHVTLAPDEYAEMQVSHNSSFILSENVPRLVAPKSLQKKSAGGKVILSWARVAGADGYYIYRASSKNGTYKKVGVIKTNKEKTPSYVDSKVTMKKKYYYRVRAYSNNKKVKSSYSSIVSQKVIVGKVEKINTTVTSRSKKKVSVNITWKKMPGATGYKVSYKVGKKGKWKLIGKPKCAASSPEKQWEKGKTYYIKIQPYVIVKKKTYNGAATTIKQKT